MYGSNHWNKLVAYIFFYISWVYARYMYGHKAFVAKADYTVCAENLLSKDAGEALISFFGIFYA